LQQKRAEEFAELQKQQQAARAASQQQIQTNLINQGTPPGVAAQEAKRQVEEEAMAKVQQDIAGAAGGTDPELARVMFTPTKKEEDEDDNNRRAPTYTETSSISGIMKASGFDKKDEEKSTYSPSTDPYSEPGRPGGMNQYSNPTASANIPTGGGSFIPFEKGGLASKPKTKPKTKRNRKKGLGGNS
jgi:hypothetical protein